MTLPVIEAGSVCAEAQDNVRRNAAAKRGVTRGSIPVLLLAAARCDAIGQRGVTGDVGKGRDRSPGADLEIRRPGRNYCSIRCRGFGGAGGFGTRVAPGPGGG